VDNNIDIIHSNTSVINIGGLISKYSGIKHVWHIREFADLDFNIYPLIPRKKCYKFMNRYTDRFICVSKAVADHYDMLDSEKKEVVYNGISITDPLSSDITNHEDNISRILIAGAIYPGKGQHEAVAACAELYKQGFKDFELLIVGEGKNTFQCPMSFRIMYAFLGRLKIWLHLEKQLTLT
jgi:glycosyltransferase involved in cell wall biosynthesis